jgi:hypothetical protein
MQRLERMIFVFILAGAAFEAAEAGDAGRPPSAGAAAKTVSQDSNEPKPAKPRIESTEFGSITIGGKVCQHDVVIRLDGKVEKRKKKLSKQETGSGHLISLDEARQVYQEGAVRLIVGTGQSGMVKLSDAAVDFFKQKGCAVELLPTPAAIGAWNAAQGAVIGLFHVTC